MRGLLVAISLLIIYGSLYPFDFSVQAYDDRMLVHLFDFGLGQVSRGDLVANLALFIPFGFLAIRSGIPTQSSLVRWIIVIAAGFVFAFGIQIVQLIVPGRVPSGGDAVLNLIGCVVGSLIGTLVLPGSKSGSKHSGWLMSIPTVLALLWIVSNWAPFIPSLDFQLFKNNVKALIDLSSPQGLWVFRNATMWLVAFYFLAQSKTPRIRESYYPLLVLIVLASGLLFVGNSPSIERALGAVLALVTWFLFQRHLNAVLLAGMVALVITGINYSPFDLRPAPIDFSWVPFSGSLSGNLLLNVLVIFKKAILYGSLIWLLVESNLGLRMATLTVSVFLFASEVGQIFFYSTTPELTDALIALGIGGVFRWYQDVLAGRGTSPSALGDERGPNRMDVVDKLQFGSRLRVIPTGVVTPRNIPAMDGLRALAALAVFAVHFNQTVGLDMAVGPFELDRFLSNGNTGVALFFILSGLLLSIPFWQAKASNNGLPEIKKYAWRRAARILPAYYLCLLVLLFGRALFGSGTSWDDIISHLFFVYNFSDRNILSLNQPFWTLAVEMQFYVLLPLLFLALRKVQPTITLVIVLCLILGFYLANFGLVTYLQSHADWPIEYDFIWPFALYLEGPTSFVLTYSTLAHLPHFLIGVGAARVFLILADGKKVGDRKESTSEVLVWFGVLSVFVILSTPLDDVLQVPLGRYNFPFVPLLLAVIVVCVPFTRIARSVLDIRLLAWLGAISYGIYIYHYPVQKLVAGGMKWAHLSVPDNALLFGLGSLAITLACSQVSYTWFEVPAIRWIRHRLRSEVENEGSGNVSASVPLERGGRRPAEADAETASVFCNARTDTDTDTRTEGGDPVEQLVNLRSPQLSFVEMLANNLGTAPSQIFNQLVIDAAKARLDDHPAVTNFVVLPGRVGQLSAHAADRGDWVRVRALLQARQARSLGVLAEKSGSSPSSTLRHLIADYMAGRGASAAQGQRPRLWGLFFRGRSRSLVIAAVACTASLVLVPIIWLTTDPEPRIAEGAPWAALDASLVLDLHTHSAFSDGAFAPEDLVERAIEGGCDALAITDHSFSAGTLSEEQAETVDALREQYPRLRLFLGVELGIPSYGGREHANVLLSPERERGFLPTLRNVAELSIENARNNPKIADPDASWLRLVSRYRLDGEQAFVIYNHPSRKDPSPDENLSDLLRWNAEVPIFSAIAGAPGHQRSDEIGGYRHAVQTLDRWDPVVAEVGGVWDQLLSRGQQIWGALASSDFHNPDLDYAPCEFSRIHLAVPGNGYTDILTALLAGTFWADHGRILDRLRFSAELDNLDRPAYAGDIVQVGNRRNTALISVSVQRGSGSQGVPLDVELIGNCLSGTVELLATQRLASGQSAATTLVPLSATGSDERSCFIRARVRAEQGSGPDHMAYTNPIRFEL